MKLDRRVCSRARLARDARFDGKFFIAVLTTGIYCRPICRSRTSQEKNVRYYFSAAAAAQAGFRPCLRCRPESSPGTPAWAGTQNTVSRALRLIGEAGLEDGGVEALAGHLGVGSRHLRRLFLRHLGVTPSAVAQTRRLNFAKKLIDETRLSMTQIALSSGFGSVRRFNASIRNFYRRTPTQIRSSARQKITQPENQYFFQLHFRPPYDWEKIVDFFAAHATPGVESVSAGVYRRSISVTGSAGAVEAGSLEVSLHPTNDSLAVRVQIADPRALFFIIARVRAMFDLDADWAVIAKTLGADPVLAPLIRSHPGLRVPGCWNGFELAVRALLGEQSSLAKTNDLATRLVKLYGQTLPSSADGLTHLFPSPHDLASASLTPLKLPAPRVTAIQTLARAVATHQLTFDKILDSDALLARLSQLLGINEWTLQYLAMRVLREPDAFPASDRRLASVLASSKPRCPNGHGNVGLNGHHNGRPARPTNTLDRRSQIWRPWRAYAAMYLWTFPSLIAQPSPSRSESSHFQTPPKRAVAASSAHT